MSTSCPHLYQLIELDAVVGLFLASGDFVELEKVIDGSAASPFMSATSLQVALPRTIVTFAGTIIPSGSFFGLYLVEQLPILGELIG